MKKLAFAALAAVALFGPLRPAFAVDAISLVNDVAIGADNTYDMDVREYSQVTAIAVYSTATLSVGTFDDGAKSTATITFATTTVSGKTVWIGNVRFLEGTDWTAVGTASGCAKALSDAIVAKTSLQTVVTATWTAAGIVYTTSTVPSATPYTLATSSPAAMNLNGSTLAVVASSLNGADPKVRIATDDLLTVSAHGLNTGFAIYITTVSGTMPTGLTFGTTYYAIRVNNNQIKVATTKANALLGTPIDITAITGGGSMRINPVAISGNPSFKWQGSNDGTNFADLSVSSVTITASGTTAWDFGVNAYRTLRLKYASPTFGGANLTVSGAGRR